MDPGATPIVEYVVEQRDVGAAATSGARQTRIEAEVLRDRCQPDKEVGWSEASRVPGGETRALVGNLDADRKYQFRVIPEHGEKGGRGNKSVPSVPFSIGAPPERGIGGRNCRFTTDGQWCRLRRLCTRASGKV